MSTETKTKKAYDGNELVDYTAPLLQGTSKQTDVYVCVNGEDCQIKRGIPVKIKRKFYDALMNAANQQVQVVKTINDVKEQGKKAIAQM